MRYLIQHFVDDSFRLRADCPAIKQGSQTYTYGQVNELATQFARHYAALGLVKGSLIGILSRVRIEVIAAMIGALRSGIVYVPLNIHAPTAWLNGVIRRSGIKTLLVDPGFRDKARALDGVSAITLLGGSSESIPDRHLAVTSFETVTQSEGALAEPSLVADDLAYILYTSGSTGDPKGIAITHRNAFTFIDWMRQEYSIGEHDRVFNRAPLQFDLSVFDIFSTLAGGGLLVLTEPEFEATPEAIVSRMIQERITVIYTVPSAYIALLTKGELSRGIPTLRWLLYAGEPFPTAYLRQVMQCLPTTAVSNIYGPTETNIVTYHHLRSPPVSDASVPIGRPVHDTDIRIVDETLKPVPDGEIGEILVRGGTVFAGYFNDPERTRRKLVQSPLHDHSTLCCRTGDLGRILPNGEIAYHGRMDSMVKSRGYRIEIGEVENALCVLPEVAEAAIVTRPHDRYGCTLHAFLVLRSDTAVDAIRRQMEAAIPKYMVPYEFIARTDLPKTATGKIDRVLLQKSLLEGGQQL
ncbi:amino acid adenylation domain-containing protein [Paraburkholderia sp. NMBU_R16]|uniref:amino acid adenylation domain-containing protein n=1 Tax=Paraburkholderia sp. NMBU_R16 TaxID=2698676 RepID=UPI0015649EAC|nr:amino acid adenylation domain-containing protein [Paraburkholderia sp. NMBU_R16]NRO99388.1 amino acid adenylation domain-containing protein [Paraburkholderia sp. NMBU_R16]